MTYVDVRPVTPDRFPDLAAVLEPRKTKGTCWCLAWRISDKEFRSRSADERGEYMKSVVEGAEHAPGVIAYVDGQPAGWCSVSPQSDYARFVSSRSIPRNEEAWSVACFVVLTPFRGQGLAEQLLNGAVEHAAASGATVIEGYPVDPAGGKVNPTLAYVGTKGVFERCGFTQAGETSAKSDGRARLVMRRSL